MNIRSLAKVILRARKIRSDERLFFENVMIPAFGRFNVRQVLFVGVAPYTWHYRKLFVSNGMELYTLDSRPEAAVWGVRNRHFICDISNVQSIIGGLKFDLVILMGIVGYGLNSTDDIRDTYDVIADILSDDGRILMACESRFGLDPVKAAEGCVKKFTSQRSYCFRESTKLPGFDYGFHFIARQSE